MKFVTVTELRLRATDIVKKIEESRDVVVVTKKGKPVVLMQFITDEMFCLKENDRQKRQ